MFSTHLVLKIDKLQTGKMTYVLHFFKAYRTDSNSLQSSSKKKHQIFFAIKHAFRVVLWEILLYFDRHGQEKGEALQHLNAQCAKFHCVNHQKEVVILPPPPSPTSKRTPKKPTQIRVNKHEI